ncbi:alpha/beta fold hydrolase [Corynebacterium pseudogenitalium]|uniref:Carboxylic ester hydrolase n=1 Tax=Corynebacterium pseudogenitalium TaxID=38303 RepID=A0ABD4TUN9_9CORY|nr:alpha/beta fold hydrolase [Corynebacterium pseudogenitalium]MCQ4614496.1 alpha/beta fold hydrolase [Corynebacterium pseudogenitalium]
MDVTITCPAGAITGTATATMREFHSIPYSRIDVPFDPPRPAPEGHLIDATTPHPDTIGLSITTPATARALDDYPVMVYLHGGRFEEGNHCETTSQPEAFAKQGVVQVRVGYRRKFPGLLPFTNDTSFRAVEDCQEALRWVLRNIEHFGGDPTNVTLVGHSAGAALALWLARRDHYQGAFRRVLALSPAFPRVPFAQRKWAARGALGTPLTRLDLNWLAERRPDAIERAYQRFRTQYFHDIALGPAPFEPAELAEVPIVVTSTREEFHQSGEGFNAFGATFIRCFGRFFGAKSAAARRNYIEAARTTDPGKLAGRFFSDALIRRWVDAACEHGPADIRQIEFCADTPLGHSYELDTLFGEPTTRIGQLVYSYISSGQADWPTYRPDRQVLRASLTADTTTVVEDPLRHVRATFNQ